MGEDTLNNEEWLESVPALFKPDEAWFRSVFPCQPKLVTGLAEVDAAHARNREPHALESMELQEQLDIISCPRCPAVVVVVVVSPMLP